MTLRGYTRCPALGVFGTLVPDNQHCFGSSSRAKFTTVSGVLAFERIRHFLEVECDGLDSDGPIASPFDIRAAGRVVAAAITMGTSDSLVPNLRVGCVGGHDRPSPN